LRGGHTGLCDKAKFKMTGAGIRVKTRLAPPRVRSQTTLNRDAPVAVGRMTYLKICWELMEGVLSPPSVRRQACLNFKQTPRSGWTGITISARLVA